MCNITGVISYLNNLLSKLYSSLSSSAAIRLLVWIFFPVCLCPSREGQEAGIYTSWTLVRVLAYDLEAMRPLYKNDIIDSRNRFLENSNSWKTGFLRIGDVGPSRIPLHSIMLLNYVYWSK